MNFLMPHSPKKTIRLSKKGILNGKTFLLKDMCDVRGLKCSCGNPDFYKKCTPAKDFAPFLKQILDQGAILKGITICDEFFYSIIGENKHYGTPSNKSAPGCVPGGSSSGSAAGLTQKNIHFSIGSDTGGSVRVPASFCGLYGIRPTHGRINTDKVYPMAPSLDTIGWFSKNINTFKLLGTVFLKNIKDKSIETIVIAQDLLDLATEEVKTKFNEYCKFKFGNIKKINITHFKKDIISDKFRIIQGFEVQKNVIPWILKNNPKISSEINSRLEMANKISEKEYLQAIEFKNKLVANLNENLTSEMFAIFPTTPFSAPKLSMSQNKSLEARKKIMMMTSISGLSSRPQVSIPKFIMKNGPVGLSILGSKNTDEVILQNLHKF